MSMAIGSLERSFIKMKIVKNKLRTKMNDERLSYLFLCKAPDTLEDPPSCITQVSKASKMPFLYETDYTL